MGAKAKPVAFEFPLRGQNESFALGDQPRGTSPDMLNAIPWDPMEKRARGGPRPGTAKLCEAQLGSGARIQGLWQATLPGAQFVTEAEPLRHWFDGGDGSGGFPLAHNVGLGTYTPTWRVSTTTAAGNPTGINTAVVTADAIKIYQGVTPLGDAAPDAYDNVGATDLASAIWNADLALADCYKCTATCLLSSTATGDFRLFHGVKRSDFTDQAGIVWCKLTKDTLTLHQGTSGAALATANWPSSRPALHSIFLELIRTGLHFEARAFDGGGGVAVQIACSYTTTTSPPGDAVGFGIAGSTSTQAASVGPVDNENPGGYVGIFTVERGAINPNARQVVLLAAAGGNLYASPNNAPGTLNLVATACFSKSSQVCFADRGGKVYMTDGVNAPQVYTIADGTRATHVATQGTLPTPHPSKVVVWRDRVIYFGVRGDEQNLFASRQADPDDFLDGQDDEASAWALNTSSVSGRIGQQIHSAIPFRDDVLYVCCDSSTFAIVGDPAAGGSISTVSDATGGLGQWAWTTDPEGTVYFLGTGGFFAASPGSLVNLSKAALNEDFRELSRSNYINVVWDRDRHGAWIYVVPMETAAMTGWWYDARTKGFFPIALPNTQGPTAAATFDGDGDTGRYTLLGGRDGYVRAVSWGSITDDGTAIASHVHIGPLTAFGAFVTAQLSNFETWLGVDNASLVAEVLTGNSAEEALEATPATLATFTTGGRQSRLLTRFRGNTFFLKLSSSSLWIFEKAAALVDYGGPTR